MKSTSYIWGNIRKNVDNIEYERSLCRLNQLNINEFFDVKCLPCENKLSVCDKKT